MNQKLEHLEEKWNRMCEIFLPYSEENSIWRFNKKIPNNYPLQGWKMHISATILNAIEIFQRISGVLRNFEVVFKGPKSILELKKLNCGLYYGYSQVGKCFTVYPKNFEQALEIANQIVSVTKGLYGPTIPYDFKFKEKSIVYFRYGAFIVLKMENSDGTIIPAIKNQYGVLEPDIRDRIHCPEWIDIPKEIAKTEKKSEIFCTKFLPYKALSLRGKGGVYLGLNLTRNPIEICFMKEGSRYGETEIDGRDGFWRVKHESIVLEQLLSANVKVPQVYEKFTIDNHFYIITEYIQGENLQNILTKRVSLNKALYYCLEIAKLLNDVHLAGWIWRDCKPANLIMSKSGFVPVDFEGACRIDEPDRHQWGTNGYLAPETFSRKLCIKYLTRLICIRSNILSNFQWTSTIGWTKKAIRKTEVSNPR